MKNRTLITALFSFLFLAGCVKSSTQVVLQKISFSSETLPVPINTTGLQMMPIFTPSVFSSIPVEWSSTDNTVVSVNATGWMTVNKTGSAWIIIKDKYSATSGKCLVVVQ